MRKRVSVDELDRLERFMNNRNSYSDDFKCLTLKLIHSGQSLEEVSIFTGISLPTLYEWIEDWNKKKRGA
jgi:transposase-like protein